VPVPDSGVPAALGYAASPPPTELGIIRSHYVGRAFSSLPTRSALGVRLNNASRADLVGKRVVLIDDSIVRGTTSTKIVEMVRNAGAREVHMRISSPPTRFPCFTASPPRPRQLLAARFDVEQMARFIGVRQPRLHPPMGCTARWARPAATSSPRFCDACFTGDYPIPARRRR
jgi:amidophosphoribosyltransferase